MTFLLSDEVAMAVAAGRAVVGLETSVIGQGLPHPRNLECVERMETAIRDTGAIPGWIGVVDGAVRVGLERSELERFAEPGAAIKLARRDVPIAVASGSLGATTVSATIWAAHRAGIGVAATGGIGGVHPGPRPDVSADVLELARTPIVLVASGPKSIVDPAATAEKLEELGVALVGYGVDRLPFFVVREAPVELEHRVDTPDGAAAIAVAHRSLGAEAAIVLCNPISSEHALDRDELMAATARAETRMTQAGVAGKEVTPFLLRALTEETGGRSLDANLVLLQDNARLAAEVAVAISAATSGR
ncbi:MAG: pseudouridine-5'-phosphate glycosidase [Actinomycetota bacterium]|nr:pseudouridine-5'-phosphate glycosidase [Actinomycetota bacterium]